MSGVMTDNTVPEAHKGLHSFLYGDGGAEAHDAETVYKIRQVTCPQDLLADIYFFNQIQFHGASETNFKKLQAYTPSLS